MSLVLLACGSEWTARDGTYLDSDVIQLKCCSKQGTELIVASSTRPSGISLVPCVKLKNRGIGASGERRAEREKESVTTKAPNNANG